MKINMIKARTICFLSFVSFVFCSSSLYAGDDMAVKALNSPMVGVNKFTQIVEVGDFLGVLDKSSLQSKGRDICKSFTKGNVTESEVCLSAIEECEKENYPKLLVMLNDAAASPACEDRSVSWLCPSRRWQTIVSDITNGTNDTTKEIVGAACVSNMASSSGSGSPASPTPGTPVPSAPVPGAPPSTGSLPGSAPTPPSSGDEAKTSCSMNPLALGNVWSGVLSYLPFFMLMLVFGFKRKEK